MCATTLTACIDRTSGAGGFLNPPTHPSHTMHVRTYRNGRAEGFQSLESAASDDSLPSTTRADAALLLDAWERPALESPEVQAWIGQVLGYFKGCYRNPNKSGHEQWSASHVLIRDDRHYAPVEHAADHCGVHHIRSFYPEYQANAGDFTRAYWGNAEPSDAALHLATAVVSHEKKK